MHIGFDLRPSLLKPTGVGAYVLALAQRMPKAAPQHRFYFFSASLRDRYPRQPWPSNVTLVDRRLPVKALNLAWNRLGWPPLDRLVGAPLDLIHSPHPLLLPGRKARRVVTLHDLFFLKHPDMTEARSGATTRRWCASTSAGPTASSACRSTPPPRRGCCSTCRPRRWR